MPLPVGISDGSRDGPVIVIDVHSCPGDQVTIDLLEYSVRSAGVEVLTPQDAGLCME